VKRRRGACIKLRNEVPEDVMQKKAALLIALALNDPTDAVTRRPWTEIASIFPHLPIGYWVLRSHLVVDFLSIYL